jgi:hypothetical protein
VNLRVLETDDSVAASLDFVTEEASSGIDQKGARSLGHDKEAGLVRYELRMSRDDDKGQIAATINISVEEATGRLVGDMASCIRFIASLRPPRRIQIFSRNGPALTPPLPIPQELVPEEQGQLWILMCESLATIQEHVIERIKFPDMMRHHAIGSMADIEEWYRAARLLRGEVLSGTWNDVGMHLIPGMQAPSGVHPAVFNKNYSVRVGTQTYELGTLSMQVAAAQVNPAKPPVVHDDHLDLEMIPGDDDAMTIRMITGTSAG